MRVFIGIIVTILFAGSSQASPESRTWPSSDKAKQFVKENIVIGFLASPYGAGWTSNKQRLDYFEESRQAGITVLAISAASPAASLAASYMTPVMTYNSSRSFLSGHPSQQKTIHYSQNTTYLEHSIWRQQYRDFHHH